MTYYSTSTIVWSSSAWSIGGRSLYPSATTPIKNEGIKLGEIEAWRCWRVKNNYLFSVFSTHFNDGLWPPGQIMTATMTCENIGIHAWKDKDHALAYLHECAVGIDRYQHQHIVIGRVMLWGQIVEHEHGYLAEHARIVSVEGVMPRSEELLAFIQGVYALPMTPPIEIPDKVLVLESDNPAGMPSWLIRLMIALCGINVAFVVANLLLGRPFLAAFNFTAAAAAFCTWRRKW